MNKAIAPICGALLSLLLGAPCFAGLYDCPSVQGVYAPFTESDQCTDENGTKVAVIAHFKNVVTDRQRVNQRILMDWLNTKIKAPRSDVRGRVNSPLSRITSIRAREHLPNTMLIHINSNGLSASELLSLRNSLNSELKADLKQRGFLFFRKRDTSPASTLRPLLKNSRKSIEVELEPSFRLKWYRAPGEFATGVALWALKDADGVKAEKAWRRATWSRLDDQNLGLHKVLVAVIDSGAVIHAELPASTFVLGANYYTGANVVAENPPIDTFGHGTMIASIIAAKTDNDVGIAAVSWIGPSTGNAAEVMPIRILPSEGSPFYSPDAQNACTHDLLDALVYAVDPGNKASMVAADFWDPSKTPNVPSNMLPIVGEGASIINLSGGFEHCSKFAGRILQRIQKYFPNVLVVVAAPDHQDLASLWDVDGPGGAVYPASYGGADYDGDNLLVVTASNNYKYLTESYGKTSVDIAAPGSSVDVITHEGEVTTASGTSFAAPLVSGTAALLKALAPPNWGYRELKKYLLQTSDKEFCGQNSYRNDPGATGNRNLCKNIANGLLDLAAATEAPVKFSTYSEWEVGGTEIVKWSAPYGKNLLDNDFCGKGILTIEREDGSEQHVLQSNLILKPTVSQTYRKFTISTVPSLGLTPGSGDTAQVRLRMQCVGSQLFKDSEVFTLTAN